MTKFKYQFGGFAMFFIISMILTQLVSSQATADASESRSNLILFTRRDPGGQWPFNTMLADINTGEERPLSTDGLCCATSWSPDGNRILVRQVAGGEWSIASLIVVDADGQNRQILTDPSQVDPSNGYWSPDSTRIFFWGRDMLAESGEPNLSIYVVPADGGPIQRLLEPRSPQSGGGLTISPDGSQIAFTENHTIYTMSADGGEPNDLGVKLNIGSTITWSPDGSQIAAFVVGSNGNFELHSIASDGSSSHLLVENMGSFSYISWSPDSSELLFLAYVNGGLASTLGILDVETYTVRTHQVGQGVLESLNAITAAVWSPDGTQIIISGRYRENNPYNTLYSLYLLDHDLTQIRRLTEIAASDKVVQWQPQSE